MSVATANKFISVSKKQKPYLKRITLMTQIWTSQMLITQITRIKRFCSKILMTFLDLPVIQFLRFNMQCQIVDSLVLVNHMQQKILANGKPHAMHITKQTRPRMILLWNFEQKNCLHWNIWQQILRNTLTCGGKDI